MAFRLERINNGAQVEPMRIREIDPAMVIGREFIPSLYCNMFICGKTASGKTWNINTLLKKISKKKYSSIYLIVPTALIDNTYSEIIKQMEKRKIDVELLSMEELEPLIDMLETQDNVELGDEIERKAANGTKVAQKSIILFDDCSGMLAHNPVYNHLLTMSRHLLCKVITSSQSFIDLSPSARNQVRYLQIYPGVKRQDLQKVHENFTTNCDEFEQFESIYRHATSEKYQFLYLCDGELRKNYNMRYIIDN